MKWLALRQLYIFKQIFYVTIYKLERIMSNIEYKIICEEDILKLFKLRDLYKVIEKLLKINSLFYTMNG